MSPALYYSEPVRLCPSGIAHAMGSRENCIILMIIILSPICKARGSVEMDKGDVPIQKEYFQLWKMQRASYMEYVYYAYVTTICFRKYVVTSRCPPCI